MTSSFFNKKGNAVVDGVTVVIILFVLAIIFILAGYVLNALQPSFTEILTDTTANTTMNTFHSRTPGTLDALFAAILAILWVGAIILAFFIDTHPVFFIFTIILLVVVFILGALLSNMFTEVSDDFGLSADYPMMTYIMEHLLAFILGVVFSVVIALFAKSQMR